MKAGSRLWRLIADWKNYSRNFCDWQMKKEYEDVADEIHKLKEQRQDVLA